MLPGMHPHPPPLTWQNASHPWRPAQSTLPSGLLLHLLTGLGGHQHLEPQPYPVCPSCPEDDIGVLEDRLYPLHPVS